MKKDPCKICGFIDVTLVDGFYYCVECGTQDAHVQETIVEDTFIADGVKAHTSKKKINKLMKNAIKMSGEWHKWHTYNYILHSLADELVALGAKPSFKMKVLWIWTRYVKKYQNKEELNKTNLPGLFTQSEDSKTSSPDVSDKETEEIKTKKKTKDAVGKDINIVTRGLLLAVLYVALNLDRCDVHMSHITRFMKDGQLSVYTCEKYVPDELDLKAIPNWISFKRCNSEYTPIMINTLSMSLFKTLNLGTPIVPDLRNIIDYFIVELSLPNDFKNLVISLMNVVPCNYFDVNLRNAKKLVRVPDYEGIVMAYFMVAFKICFGLDCDYEIKLSEAVEKINDSAHHVKSYKMGMYVEQTGRLFSFREWSNYLQFRKILLSKYCLAAAQRYNLEVDDYIFMEHSEERTKRKVELQDEVTMDILNQIPLDNEHGVIPKSEFVPSLTPITSYTKVVLDYIQDPELKLLLSEDFTQYSLKYACESLTLPDSDENILKGVTEDSKTLNNVIKGTLFTNIADKEMVYVRNCENKNWLKTKPPTIEHVTKISENSNSSEKDSDHGYDSNIDCTPNDNEPAINKIETNDTAESDIEKTLEVIEEEFENINIFDDPFEDLYVKKELLEETFGNEDHFVNNDDNSLNVSNANAFESKIEFPEDDIRDGADSFGQSFNPNTFDRRQTIKELIQAACKEYKIPIPYEYSNRKRKPPLVHITAAATEVKRRKIDNRRQPGELKSEIDKLMETYQTTVHQDIFTEIIETVHNLTENIDMTDIENVKNEVNFNHADEPTTDFTDHINDQDVVNDGEENQSQNGDASVIENTEKDDFNVDELKRKGDPKFDEKSHDINQLYVKFSTEGNFEELINIDDPEVIEIIDKKLTEAIDNTQKEIEKENSTEIVDDSEDDVPLSVIREEAIRLEKKEAQNKEILDPLMKTESLTEYKYWFRHYSTHTLSRNIRMQHKFDAELKENCPKSFNFVIHECAAIVNCSAYSIYRNMQSLELMFLAKIKELDGKDKLGGTKKNTSEKGKRVRKPKEKRSVLQNIVDDSNVIEID